MPREGYTCITLKKGLHNRLVEEAERRQISVQCMFSNMLDEGTLKEELIKKMDRLENRIGEAIREELQNLR